MSKPRKHTRRTSKQRLSKGRKRPKLPYRSKRVVIVRKIFRDKKTGKKISRIEASRLKASRLKVTRKKTKQTYYYSRVTGRRISKKQRSKDWDLQGMKELFPGIKKKKSLRNIKGTYKYLSELKKEGGDEWQVAGGLYRELLQWARDHNADVLPKNLR